MGNFWKKENLSKKFEKKREEDTLGSPVFFPPDKKYILYFLQRSGNESVGTFESHEKRQSAGRKVCNLWYLFKLEARAVVTLS